GRAAQGDQRGAVVPAKGLAKYQALHDSAFRFGAWVQRVIEMGVAHPPLFSAAAAVLRARPRWADRVLAITGDVAAGLRASEGPGASFVAGWTSLETESA